ncbi:acyl-CoA dehydrogenase family protein [Streptomyces sp. KR80]|uniref:acyl-CoA dehydrogenase family protein n=1 Tax=Streptomyces sp. KR80 TaxID=3457426 RepID=UPI003FD51997
MDAAFTAEQDEIRRTLRELLHKRCGPDEVKAAARTPRGWDETLWQQLAEQLGLPGLALPVQYGGVGCGPAEAALACEETGRVLLPSPLLGSALLAAPLITELGTPEQRARLLPRIADGELTATLAVADGVLPQALGLTGDDGGDPDGGRGGGGTWAGGGRAGGIQARRVADGWRLYGQADQVLDGHSAGLLLVAAHTGGYARSRTLLFLVDAEAGAAGLVRTRRTALDETRPQAGIQLRDVSAQLLGDEGAALGATEGAKEAGALARLGCTVAPALAAEAVGAADAAFARTLEYVREREQFGRPIGSFQAVKHRLADLYVGIQAARSAAYYAAWAAGSGEGDPPPELRLGGGTPRGHLPAVVPLGLTAREVPPGGGGWGSAPIGGLALAQALEVLRTVAGEAIQLHGGIGFTWEHDAHLYFKRAASDEVLFGPVHRLRAHAAEQAGLFRGGDEARATVTV